MKVKRKTIHPDMIPQVAGVILLINPIVIVVHLFNMMNGFSGIFDAAKNFNPASLDIAWKKRT